MDAELFSIEDMKNGQDKIPTFYHSSKWIRAVAESYRIKPIIIGIRDGEYVNIMPCFLIKSKVFGNKIVSLPYCEYGGPNRYSDIDKIFKKIDVIAKANNAKYLELRIPPWNRFDLSEYGFVKGPDYFTFKIDLRKSLDSIWHNMNKKVRNSIRKAEKNNVRVCESNRIKTFYSLYIKTMKKISSPPHSLEFFQNIMKYCEPDVKVQYANYENKEIAASIFFLHQKKIYYWKNVSDENFLHLRPNDIILYNMIKWGIDNDYNEIDLGRTKMNSGVFLFKKRWGGEMKEINHLYKFYDAAKIPDIESSKYNILKKLWKLLAQCSPKRADTE